MANRETDCEGTKIALPSPYLVRPCFRSILVSGPNRTETQFFDVNKEFAKKLTPKSVQSTNVHFGHKSTTFDWSRSILLVFSLVSQSLHESLKIWSKSMYDRLDVQIGSKRWIKIDLILSGFQLPIWHFYSVYTIN